MLGKLIFLLFIFTSLGLSQDILISVPQVPSKNIKEIYYVNDKVIYSPEIKSLPRDEQKELKNLYKVENYWAKMFYLTDWKVAIFLVTYEDLNTNYCPYSCLAASDWDVSRRTGVILVLKESEYDPDMKKELKKQNKNPQADQRNSVLHEMLHNVLEHMREELAVTIFSNLLQK